MKNMSFDDIIAILNGLNNLADKIAKRIPKSISDNDDPFLELWDDNDTATTVKLCLLYLKKYNCLSDLLELLKSEPYSEYYSTDYSVFHKDNSCILPWSKPKNKKIDRSFWEMVKDRIITDENAWHIIVFFDYFLQRFCRDYYIATNKSFGLSEDELDVLDELVEKAETEANKREKAWHESCFNGLLRQMIELLNTIPQEDFIHFYSRIIEEYVPHKSISDNYELLFREISITPNDSVWLNLSARDNNVATKLNCKQVVFTTNIFNQSPNIFPSYDYRNKNYRAWCSAIIQCVAADTCANKEVTMIIPITPCVDKSYKFYKPYQEDVNNLVNKYIESHPTAIKRGEAIESNNFVNWLLNETDEKPSLFIDDINFESIWKDDQLVADKETYIDIVLEKAINQTMGRYVMIDHSMNRVSFQSPNKSESLVFLQKYIERGILEKIIFFQDCTVVFFNLAYKENFVKFVKADHLCFEDDLAWTPDYNMEQKEHIIEELIVANKVHSTPHVRFVQCSDFKSIQSLDSRRFFPITSNRVNDTLRRVFDRSLNKGVDFDDIYLSSLCCVANALHLNNSTASEKKRMSIFVGGEEEFLFDNPKAFADELLKLCSESQRNFSSLPNELVALVNKICQQQKDSKIYLPYAGVGSFFPIDSSARYYWREENPLYQLLCGLRSFHLKCHDLSDFYDTANQKYGNWWDCIVRQKIKFQNIISFPPIEDEKELDGYCKDFYIEAMGLLADRGTCIAFVPTEFIVSAIYKTDRQKIVENRWLDKVVVLPKEIFVNSVLGGSITMLVLDKSEKSQYTFMDATKSSKVVNSSVVLNEEFIRHSLYGMNPDQVLRVAYNEIDDDFAFCKFSSFLHLDTSLIPVSEVLSIANGTRPAVASGRVVEESYFDTNRCRDLSARKFKVKAVTSKLRKFDSNVMVVSTRTILGIGRPLRCIYCRATSTDPVYIDTEEFIVCSVDEKRIVPAYFDSELKKQYVSEQISLLTGGRNRVHSSDFYNLRIKVIPVAEQRDKSQYSVEYVRKLIQRYCNSAHDSNSGPTYKGTDLLAYLYKSQYEARTDEHVISVLEIGQYNSHVFDNDELEVLKHNLNVVLQYVREHLPSSVLQSFSSIPYQIGELIKDEITQYIPYGSTIYYPFANDESLVQSMTEYLFDCEEENESMWALGKIAISISGTPATLKLGNPIKQTNKFNYIFSIPPIGRQGEESTENIISTLYDRLNDGGSMVLLLTSISLKKGVLENCFEQGHLVKIIDLPKNVFSRISVQMSLVVIQKKQQKGIIMIDARHFVSGIDSTEFESRIFDFKSYIIERSNKTITVEYGDTALVYQKPYHNLNASYYVNLSKYDSDGFSSLAEIASVVPSVKLDISAKCKKLTMDQLADGFPRNPINVIELEDGNIEQWQKYTPLHRDDVIIAFVPSVNRIGLRIGYISEEPTSPTYVSSIFVVLQPKSVSVDGLMAILLSPIIVEQIDVYNIGNTIPRFSLSEIYQIRIPKLSSDELQKMVETAMKDSMSVAERELQNAYIQYQNNIHIRKHALEQNTSSLESLWNALMIFKDNSGIISLNDSVGRGRHRRNVSEIFEAISELIETITIQTKHLADIEDDWGEREIINVTEFIDTYISSHKSLLFQYDFIDNAIESDSNDNEKLIFMPIRALKQVFDNVIANAKSHGFQYEIRDENTVLFTVNIVGDSVLIDISNNGKQLADGVDTEYVITYGKSTVLNKKDTDIDSKVEKVHSGTGGYETNNILKQYGASLEIISSKTSYFKVTYRMILPKCYKNERNAR